MAVFKFIVGSTDPAITNILNRLSVEEKEFLRIVEERSDLLHEIKNAQNCTVVIDVSIPWKNVSTIPTDVLTINRKSRIILIAKSGNDNPKTFQSIIQPSQLLELAKRIISLETV